MEHSTGSEARDGGNQTEFQPPDSCPSKLRSFCVKREKLIIRSRTYWGQLVRFALGAISLGSMYPPGYCHYHRELKRKGLKAISINYALNTLKSFYQWLRQDNGYLINQPLSTDSIDLDCQLGPEADHIEAEDIGKIKQSLELNGRTAIRDRAIEAIFQPS